MSSHVVSHETINAILQAAFNAEKMHCGLSNPWRFQNDPLEYHFSMNAFKRAQQQANLLMKSNVRSVRWAYRHAPEQMPKPFTGAVTLDTTAAPVSPLQALKLIDYVSYQSCDRPGWNKSEAFKLLSELRVKLIPALPGYDNEKWGL